MFIDKRIWMPALHHPQCHLFRYMVDFTVSNSYTLLCNTLNAENFFVVSVYTCCNVRLKFSPVYSNTVVTVIAPSVILLQYQITL